MQRRNLEDDMFRLRSVEGEKKCLLRVDETAYSQKNCIVTVLVTTDGVLNGNWTY
jgi:hypothetical protein